MTALDYLLAAILADPADDLARIAFADECEQEGHDARAEFIRVQVEIARLERMREPRPGYVVEVVRTSPLGSPERLRDIGLIDQINALTPRMENLWFSPAKGFDETTMPEGWKLTIGPFMDGCTIGQIHVSRGFVTRVRCPLAAWQQHGRAIARAHPLEGGVELTGKNPAEVPAGNECAGQHFWDRGRDRSAKENELPPDVFDRLGPGLFPNLRITRVYESQDAANADLSRVLIAMARE